MPGSEFMGKGEEQSLDPGSSIYRHIYGKHNCHNVFLRAMVCGIQVVLAESRKITHTISKSTHTREGLHCSAECSGCARGERASRDFF